MHDNAASAVLFGALNSAEQNLTVSSFPGLLAIGHIKLLILAGKFDSSG